MRLFTNMFFLMTITALHFGSIALAGGTGWDAEKPTEDFINTTHYKDLFLACTFGKPPEGMSDLRILVSAIKINDCRVAAKKALEQDKYNSIRAYYYTKVSEKLTYYNFEENNKSGVWVGRVPIAGKALSRVLIFSHDQLYVLDPDGAPIQPLWYYERNGNTLHFSIDFEYEILIELDKLRPGQLFRSHVYKIHDDTGEKEKLESYFTPVSFSYVDSYIGKSVDKQKVKPADMRYIGEYRSDDLITVVRIKAEAPAGYSELALPLRIVSRYDGGMVEYPESLVKINDSGALWAHYSFIYNKLDWAVFLGPLKVAGIPRKYHDVCAKNDGTENGFKNFIEAYSALTYEQQLSCVGFPNVSINAKPPLTDWYAFTQSSDKLGKIIQRKSDFKYLPANTQFEYKYVFSEGYQDLFYVLLQRGQFSPLEKTGFRWSGEFWEVTSIDKMMPTPQFMEGPIIYGNESAPNTVTLFINIECPATSQHWFNSFLPSISELSPKEFKVILQGSAWSEPSQHLLVSVMAIAEQNKKMARHYLSDLFRELDDRGRRGKGPLSSRVYPREWISEQINKKEYMGFNIQRFEAMLEEPFKKAQSKASDILKRKYKLRYVPALIINGKVVDSDSVDYSRFIN